MKRIYLIWVTILALLVPAIASAQTTAFSVEGFEPEAVQKTAILNVATTELLPAGITSLGLFSHFVDDALQLKAEKGPTKYNLLDDQYKAEFAFGLGLFDGFEFGAVLPLTLYQTGASLQKYNKENREVSSFAFSDPRLNIKTTLFNYSGFGAAINLTGYIPIGNTRNFHSDGTFRAQPELIFDWRSESLKIATNLGYQFRSAKVLRNVGSDDWLMAGGGLQYNFLPSVGILATINGGFSLADGRDPSDLSVIVSNDYARPLETHAGFRFDLEGDWTINLGGGMGLSPGIGAPDFRIFGGIEYVAFPEGAKQDLYPEKMKERDPEKMDSDQDGIPDLKDACPESMEDVDGFEDEDGCPDEDNDQDKILDMQDECPDLAGIPEKQGCPFVDSDKDGIDDESDACPKEAEDVDKFEDDDGCPDLDNDGDGIADLEDKCPLQAEVINGVKDEDGCPDSSDSKVRVTRDKIEIFEMVYFDTNKATIQARSKNILNQVRSVLRANPQIQSLRIEGHTDSRGSVKSNQDLSQRRAEAVLKYFVDSGINASRLEAKGFGEMRPVEDNKNKKGRTENRRVEFFILKVKSK